MNIKLLYASILSVATATAAIAQTTDSNTNTTQPQQEGHHWKRRHDNGFFHELRHLNLTDAQKQQVHQIFDSNKVAFHTGMLNVLKAKQALQAAVDSNPDNQTNIQTLATNAANAEAAVTVQRIAVRAQVIKILTADQKTQLTQLEAKRQAHLQKFIDHLSGTSNS
jgi:Spy/CpxP family protein refolding chaperone